MPDVVSKLRSLRLAAVLLPLLGAGTTAAHATGNVVISQVYGGGGNTGAPYTHDYVELFNRSAVPVSLAGWSIQYASATGTGNLGATANQITVLPGITLQPGRYLLVQQASGAVGVALPAPDVVAANPIAMSATAGKVALVSSAVTLGCNGGSTPCSAGQSTLIVDLVGYGGANFFESAPTAVLSNSTAARRAGGGCTDTNVNNADFTVGAPQPRNSATAANACGVVNAPVVANCPAIVPITVGVGGTTAISAQDTDGTVATAAITSTPVAGIALQGIVPGTTLTAQLEVSAAVAAGNYSVDLWFTNSDATPQSAGCTIAINVAPPATALRIRDIQGAAHLSPRRGQTVGPVPGVVTAVRSNGFYFQDPAPDASDATSEGLFVFTSSAPSVAVGDSVAVSGTVTEFRPGGTGGAANLTITEITSPTVQVLSSGNALPAPVVLGSGGRAIPTQVIDDDSSFDVETSGSFDAATDGIDFLESLEGMRVRINAPVATGPTNGFGELSVLADGGANAGLRTARGGIIIRPTDFNPERLILDDALAPVPTADTGDALSSVEAIVDYSFGNFKLAVTATPSVTDNGPVIETASVTGNARRLTIASYNVENLDAADPASRFTAIAGQVVNRLRAPDILSVVEIQDNNGATNNGVVDASQTYALLIAAIQAAGGPAYQYRDIPPVNNQDGGEPGGNIRVGFLFNPARVSFVDRPGGGPLVSTTALLGSGGLQLSVSPGRIDPTHSAWNSSRKPLVGEFLFAGAKLFVIVNHFNSKGGDDPLFGRVQPPVRSSEVQRVAQAAKVSSFVQSLQALDPAAAVVVLGDLNDFQFSDVLTVLKTGSDLVNLVDSLPEAERYTYVFDGNAQSLDHLLISPALAATARPAADIVHMNSEFSAQISDHDPLVAGLTLATACLVDADDDIDRNDIALITAARNQSASGPADPRDPDRNGVVNVLDARQCSVRCDRPQCAP
jgi:hypothetical protein